MAKEVKSLEAHAIIGFDGSAIKGLKVHPDGEHIIYPMGNKVCIQHWKSKQMHFLSGHSNSVSTVAVSFDGKYIGSGQINHIGFKALVILWDFQKKIKIGSHELHKVRVEALTFSSDARFLISLGGRDDGALVLWNCEAGAATATAPAARLTTGDATCAASLNKRPNAFVTGGDSNLRVWSMRPGSSSLEVVDVALGKLRRCVRSLAIADDDSIGYAGTTSGDIIKFSINYPADPSVPVDTCKPALIGCLAKCGRQKKNQKPEAVCYSQGVESILLMSDGCLVVGGGDGSVDALREGGCRAPPKTRLCQPTAPSYKALRSVKLPGSITSLELMESAQMQGDNRILLAGTRTSEIYAINVKTFEAILVVTCHRCAINDIAFPKGMSGVFATAGAGSARVWSAASAQELLRIEVPNFVCSAVLFTADGKSLVTAWNDGCIRAFTPLTGRLMYCILNTHNKGASALDMTTDGTTLVSGGCEGQVRVWDIKPQCQTLKKVLKEHKSPVSAIQVSPNNCEAVSAGTDGSCIIWDLISLSRRRVLYANTLFSCARYEPGGCQLLTAGSDRRVACWETATGTLARELEASKVGAVNGLDISYNGELFATGANDQMVKLWKYQEGIYTHTGLGHAGAVTCLRFSPDMRYIVSCCAAGSIVIWKMPAEYIPKTPPPTPASERLSLKLPSAPSKDEKIEKMNTSRSSVHACCPCEPPKPPSRTSLQSSGDSAKSGGSRGSKGSGANVKDNLPKKTPSKESVNSGGGDKRK